MTIITRANSPYKISNGVNEFDDTVSSGGSMYVLSGGHAIGTLVEPGGLLTVSAGGSDSATLLSGGETLRGVSVSGTILDHGTAIVASGGTALDPTISAGGILDVVAGGVVSGNVTNGGKVDTTANGGLILSSTVTNSGTVAALGTDARLVLSAASVVNSGGLILASGIGAQVDLYRNTEIYGGTLATSGAGAFIELPYDLAVGLTDVTLTKGSILRVNEAELGLAGTINNSGTISEIAGIGIPEGVYIGLDSEVTLTGGGKLLLAPNGQDAISADVSASGTLTVADNTIAGAGNIGWGNQGGALTFINDDVVDADVPKGVLSLDTENVVETNAGKLEATNGGTLVIYGSIISNTASGLIEAVGYDVKHHHHVSSVPAFVVLDGGTVSGGTLKAMTGGEILAEYTSEGPSYIADASIASGTTVIVTSGGTLNLTDVNIEAGATVKVANGGEVVMVSGTIGHGAVVETLAGGSAAIAGTVTNSGTIFAAASGSYIRFAFATVTGGVAEVGNGTAEIYGGEAVTFETGGTGTLVLDDSSSSPIFYSGQVSHFGQNIHQAIDLTNVTYVSGAESATFSGTTTSGLLTVTSGGITVAKINLIGDYQHVTFSPHDYTGTVGSSGSLEITDPPAQPSGHHHDHAGHSANLGLLGNYIAGFPEAGHGGILISSTGQSEAVPLVLVHPHG